MTSGLSHSVMIVCVLDQVGVNSGDHLVAAGSKFNYCMVYF